MAPKAPIRPPTIRDQADTFQREVNRTVKQLNAVQQDSRVYVRNVVVTSSSTPVKHGLGRVPAGWQVSDKTVTCDIFRDPAAKSTADTIFLKCSVASATVDLVFW